MSDAGSLETLLRECGLIYGHIQLFRDAEGWQASVYHYKEPKVLSNSKVMSDPVNALRAALLEDERQERDIERRYAAAQKLSAPKDEFEDLFG